MNDLIRLLGGQSLKDLFKYKSFFLLVFLLFLLDRLLRVWWKLDRSALGLEHIKQAGLAAAPYLFDDFPGQVLAWLSDPNTLAVLVGLFALKQVISLWPSSDMRLMHRQERSGLGIFHALFKIRWEQILWDALAVASICLVVGGWSLASFVFCRFLYHQSQNQALVLLLAFLVFLSLPLAMAGFSYSSKLAVLSEGSFGQKMGLYLKLFTDRRILLGSWLFYLLRILIETLFVALIPAGAILLIDQPVLRILVAGVSATPVYSFLKMASFKFFLVLYRPYPLVQAEYARFYQEF